MYNIFRNRANQKKAMKKPKVDGELHRLQRLLKEEIKEKFSSRLKLYVIDSGSCGACDFELQALFNPLYDVSTIGIELVYDVKEADMMLLTGLLTENIYPICFESYQNLREPKHVITIGDCMMSHAPFQDTFAIKGQASIHFLSQIHIKDCPPNPKSLLRGLLKYLQSL